jgi:hypothetical protein
MPHPEPMRFRDHQRMAVADPRVRLDAVTAIGFEHAMKTRIRRVVLGLVILCAPGASLAQETIVASYPDTSPSAFCEFRPPAVTQPFAPGDFFYGSCRPLNAVGSDSQIAVPFFVPAFSRMQPTRFAAAVRGLLTQYANGRVRIYDDAVGGPDEGPGELLGDFDNPRGNLVVQSAGAGVCPSGPPGAAVLAQFTLGSPPVL